MIVTLTLVGGLAILTGGTVAACLIAHDPDRRRPAPPEVAHLAAPPWAGPDIAAGAVLPPAYAEHPILSATRGAAVHDPIRALREARTLPDRLAAARAAREVTSQARHRLR